MKTHERDDSQESTVSNEVFWGVVAVALALICAIAGTLLGIRVS